MRVALYARVSTDMQAEEGLSISAQLNEMREFVARRDWTIAAEFVDPGYSGSSTDRPGLQALLQAFAQNQIDVLLVHELSRLSRSIFDTFDIFETLGRRNIGFASVKEPNFDFSSPQGRLFLTILSAMNQYYLDLIKQHTAKGKRERARQGLYNASIIPHGYQNVGDPSTPPRINETESPAVRLAFETYVTGNISYQDVADRLNDAGYRTRSGGRFGKDTIDDMLRNPFYVGDIVYGTKHKSQEPEIFKGQHELLISRDLFEACQRIREKRRGSVRSYQAAFRVYLLNAISVCSICGRDLRAQATVTNRYYREMSRSRGFVDCPHAQQGVVADIVEGQLEAIFRALELPADWQAEVEELLDRQTDIEVLHNRRARLQAELRRLREMNIKGQFEDDPEQFDQEYNRVRRELDALPTSDLGAVEEAAQTLSRLAEVWDEADMQTKRDLIRLVVNRLEIDVQQGRLVSLTPYAPFLPLLRHASHLIELDHGQFIPLWPPEQAADKGPDPVLPPLTHPPVSPSHAVVWPLVLTWPERPSSSPRISLIVSHFLKTRRLTKTRVKRMLEISHPLLPLLRLDERKWPGVDLERLRRTNDTPPSLNLAEGTVSFLRSPLVLQANPAREAWLQTTTRWLDEAGWWVLSEVMPLSMPGHWLYRYFPEAWPKAKALYLDMAQFYTLLQKYGLEAEVEQHTYYQAVSYTAALALAETRPAGTLLAELSEGGYQAGLARLRTESAAQGGEKLLASHFCVAEVMAYRPAGRKKTRRRGGKP